MFLPLQQCQQQLNGLKEPPAQLNCLDSFGLNEALEAMELLSLSQDSQVMAGANKVSAIHSHMTTLTVEVEKIFRQFRNANHVVQNLTADKLKTTDGQLLLLTSAAIDELARGDFISLCQCEEATTRDFQFQSLQLNPSEELLFK